MPGIITTTSFSKLLWPGINKVHGDTYAEHPVEYSKIFDKVTSTKAFEEYQQLTGFGLVPVKTQGAAMSMDSATQGYTTRLTNIVYALAFTITREMYDDGQYGPISSRLAKFLAFSMRQTKEIVMANILNRGFTSTYAGADGKELFATDHPNSTGGTFSNELAVAADISGASLEEACIAIMNFQNDRGLQINIMPQSLNIPPALIFEAERILKSSLEYDSANGALNALKSTGMFPGGINVNHYLTDTDAWIIKTNCPEGLIYHERDADNFSAAVENDYLTDNAIYKGRMRFTGGWIDPRGAFGSPGA
jgi:phage major head subunit gpT-like protein